MQARKQRQQRLLRLVDHNSRPHGARRLGELRRSFLDTTRAAESLRFTAMVGLEDGLRATWEWVEKT